MHRCHPWDEGIDGVWAPVDTVPLADVTYRLPSVAPQDRHWVIPLGSVVRVNERSDGL